MAKLILIAVALWLVITILKRYRKNLEQSGHPHLGSSGNAETMVQCAHCGIHLPLSESIESNGRYFCSKAHAHSPNDEHGH
jgi:uncharacterized protein